MRRRPSLKVPKPVLTGREEDCSGTNSDARPRRELSFRSPSGSPVAITTPYSRVYGAHPNSVDFDDEGRIVALLWTTKGVAWLEDMDGLEIFGSPEVGSILTEKQLKLLEKTGDTRCTLKEKGVISEGTLEHVALPAPYSPREMKQVSELAAPSTPANTSAAGKSFSKRKHPGDVPCGCSDISIISAVCHQKQQTLMAWMRARVLALEIWLESLSVGR